MNDSPLFDWVDMIGVVAILIIAVATVFFGLWLVADILVIAGAI
jgi:hypothetical protein